MSSKGFYRLLYILLIVTWVNCEKLSSTTRFPKSQSTTDNPKSPDNQINIQICPDEGEDVQLPSIYTNKNFKAKRVPWLPCESESDTISMIELKFQISSNNEDKESENSHDILKILKNYRLSREGHLKYKEYATLGNYISPEKYCIKRVQIKEGKEIVGVEICSYGGPIGFIGDVDLCLPPDWVFNYKNGWGLQPEMSKNPALGNLPKIEKDPRFRTIQFNTIFEYKCWNNDDKLTHRIVTQNSRLQIIWRKGLNISPIDKDSWTKVQCLGQMINPKTKNMENIVIICETTKNGLPANNDLSNQLRELTNQPNHPGLNNQKSIPPPSLAYATTANKDKGIVYMYAQDAVFHGLTALVYLLILDKLDVYGFSVLMMTAAFAFAYTSSAIIYLNEVDGFWPIGSISCVALAICSNFFYLCSYSWLLVIAFDFWFMSRSETRQALHFRGISLFGIYSAFAMGLPLLVVVIGRSIDIYNLDKEIYDRAGPGYGYYWPQCTLKPTALGPYLYYLEISIMLLIFFSLWNTFSNLRATSEELKKSSKITRLQDEFNVFGRVFMIITITWAIEMFSWYNKSTGAEWYCDILRKINSCAGLPIFVFFVWNKNKLDQVVEKWPFLSGLRDQLLGISGTIQKAQTFNRVSKMMRRSPKKENEKTITDAGDEENTKEVKNKTDEENPKEIQNKTDEENPKEIKAKTYEENSNSKRKSYKGEKPPPYEEIPVIVTKNHENFGTNEAEHEENSLKNPQSSVGSDNEEEISSNESPTSSEDHEDHTKE